MVPIPLIEVVLKQPILTLVGIAAFSFVAFTFIHAKRGSYPPGPRQYPIIGSIFDMPHAKQYIKFSEWKRTYGDIVGLKNLGQNILVLNSRKTVEDLLVKRGATYASRPPSPLLSKWGGLAGTFITLPYGTEMSTQRRLLGQHMNRTAVKAFDRNVTREALALIPRLQADPKSFDTHLNTLAVAVIVRTLYGFDVQDQESQWIALFGRMFQTFRKFTGISSHPVDMFPQLSHLPSTVFGRQLWAALESLRSVASDMVNLPFDALRKDIANGTANRSMVKTLIEDNTQDDGSIQNQGSIQAISAFVYITGPANVQSALRTFLIAMMLYPEVQKKAQAAIDAVVQGQRAPSLQDKESLPYIEAILKELLRWKPVVPLAIPHMSSEDDEYQGYHIPAKTIVIANAWQCLHDENDYPQPDVFRPERFMDGDVAAKSVLDPRDIAFGFGRRVCPGRNLAENILWMNMMLILYTFDISLPKDEQGRDIQPDLVYLSTPTVSYAKSYQCNIRLRSLDRLEVVKLAHERLAAATDDRVA